MPSLEWIGKDKVINHHLEVPFRTLEHKYSYDENGQHLEDNGSENMIIHGDNLEALKSLLPRFEGKIKCIYIDPPYNTGNEKWVYNDNVNDPKIRKWLGEVVGKEGEDLSRHDKWLCMMCPRLRLLQKLLAPDGTLAISINHFEVSNLLAICKEIFSAQQVQTVSVQTSGGKPSAGFNISNEYLIFVTPNDFIPNSSQEAMNSNTSPYHGMNLATFTQEQRPNQVYPIFIDENGVIVDVGQSLQERVENGLYVGELKDFKYDYSEAPAGTVAVWPVTQKGDPCVWRLIPDRLKRDWNDGYIKVIPQKNSNNANRYSVQYLAEGIIKKIQSQELETIRFSDNPDIPTLEIVDFMTGGVGIHTMWSDKRFYTTKGSNELTQILGKKGEFPYPKPIDFITEIITRITQDNDIILDSFAGSGTTAHAVLNANRDGGSRRFILVEMMDYADRLTAERVKRAIDGYSFTGEVEETIYSEKLTLKKLSSGEKLLKDAEQAIEKSKADYDKISKPKIQDQHLIVTGTKKFEDRMPGLGGNFSFYELGEPLLIDGKLNERTGVNKIREYIWFTETKASFVEPVNPDNRAFLGSFAETAYYFYYDPDSITTLDHDFLGTIKQRAAGYVIYADLCALSAEELKRFGIVFKKIPRDITKL